MKYLDSLLCAQPDFFIIGAMKSGTTSLFQYLNFHSCVESSLIKEPCYYSYNFGNGKRWYLEQFPSKKLFGSKVYYFDASPVYLHDALAPARMFADYPQAKLIVICRDPIERAVSHYNYYSNKDSNFGKKPENHIDERGIEQAFGDDISGREHRTFFRYCHMSRYAEQMARFLNYYSCEQVLFVDLKELETDVVNTLMRVAGFLKLPNPEEFRRIAVSSDQVNSQASFQKTEQKLIKRFNTMKYDISVSEALKSSLHEFFYEDVLQLQRMAGRSFSWTEKYIP